MKKVIVGISGGVDSAVTALLLKSEGYEVTGCHFVFDKLADITRQKIDRISQILEIPIIILDVKDEFHNTVIEYFRQEHLNGRTPGPCSFCNPNFKWKQLLLAAQYHNAEFVSSGHYARKEFIDGYWYIVKGKDLKKDQSYYLWGLSQALIERMVLPLGQLTKEETKSIAVKNNLGFLATSKESAGLCFANGLPYTDLLKKLIPESQHISMGEIVDRNGNVIGEHSGYLFYTIGQKRELSFTKPDNKCVIGIDAKNNRLVAGKPEELWKNEFPVDQTNFANLQSALKIKQLSVKIRGFGWNPKGYCKLVQSDSKLQVKLENKAWAPASGQPAVFYENDIVIGGGTIC